MLLSKKPEMLLPGNHWPSYFSKAKKNLVWDLNNKKYVDMMMYVGVIFTVIRPIDNYVSKYSKKFNILKLSKKFVSGKTYQDRHEHG